jgi:hypothetical protein
LADYNPPNSNNLFFKFSDVGYTPPSNDDLQFKFSYGVVSEGTVNLNSIIKVFAPGQENVSSDITGIKFKSSYDLNAYLYSPFYINIKNTIRGVFKEVLDISSIMTAMGIYQNSDYTYLKDCPTIIVGYDSRGPKTLKLPCRYGGIRDIGGYLKVNPPHFDLRGTINGKWYIKDLKNYVKPTIKDTVDLIHYIKPAINSFLDVNSVIKMYSVGNIKDVFSTIRMWGKDQYNVSNLIRGYSRDNSKDIFNTIRGWKPGQRDIPNYLKPNFRLEKDVAEYLKPTYPEQYDYFQTIRPWHRLNQKNLKVAIRGWTPATHNIPNYLKVNFRLSIDINHIMRVYARNVIKNVAAFLHGWAEYDLPGIVPHIYNSFLLWGKLGIKAPPKDLGAYLQAVRPVDISSSIDVWHIFDLPAYMLAEYGANDIRAYINVVQPVDLKAYLKCMLGLKVSLDLPGYVTSYGEQNINSYIETIEPFNLGAYIFSVGKLINIPSQLVPKITLVKNFINIALLSHIDIKGVINAACFGSGYKDLNAYINPKVKFDLRGYIYSSIVDNMFDIKSYINSEQYLVEDSITIRYNRREVTRIPLSFSVRQPSYTYNYFTVRYKRQNTFDFYSYIYGQPLYMDLGASIIATINLSYTMKDRFDEVKSRDIVVNVIPGEPFWQREVEFAFREAVDQYYFFSGEEKVYKADRNSKWSIRIEGFKKVTDNTIDRAQVKKKYIFDLRDYSTIDEAMRDVIDRVSILRKYNLESLINAVGGYKDISARVLSVGYKYKGFRDLPSRMDVTSRSNYQHELISYITGERNKLTEDIGSVIVGTYGEFNEGNSIRIRIDHTKIDSDLTNFPILVNIGLTSGSSDYDSTSLFEILSDGSGESYDNRKKIRFIANAFGSQVTCPAEISYWNHTLGSAHMWVKVPFISSSVDTEIYLWYNIDIDSNLIDDSGSTIAQDVWDDNYLGVWHFDGSFVESSSNRPCVYGTPEFVSGIINGGGSLYCDGSYAEGQVNNFPGFTSCTVETFMKPLQGDGAWGNNVISATPTKYIIHYNWHGASSTKTISGLTPETTFTIQELELAHVSINYDGSVAKTYKNGALHDQFSVSGFTVASGTSIIFSGLDIRTGYTYKGYLDETRISNIQRSGAWTKATNYSTRDNLLIFG